MEKRRRSNDLQRARTQSESWQVRQAGARRPKPIDGTHSSSVAGRVRMKRTLISSSSSAEGRAILAYPLEWLGVLK